MPSRHKAGALLSKIKTIREKLINLSKYYFKELCVFNVKVGCWVFPKGKLCSKDSCHKISRYFLVKPCNNTEINYIFSDHQDLLSLGVNTDFSICLSQYLPLRSINLDVLSSTDGNICLYVLSIVFHLHYIKLWVCQSPRMQSLRDKVKKEQHLFNHSPTH